MRDALIGAVKRVLRPITRHRHKLEKLKYHLAGETILNGVDGNDRLGQMLHKPGVAGKIGGTEMKLCRVYLRRRDASGNCQNFGYYARLIYISSGVYPPTPEILNRFCREYLDLLSEIDLLAVWYNMGEAATRKRFAPKATLANLPALEPYFHPHPWSAQLAGKRVVVISPFAKSIESQYAKRKQIWRDKPDVLPEFSLRTIRCPQIAGLVDELEYPDWFAGLEAMKKQLESEPLDVAIIGAGAWSIPLAVHAKKLGAFGIHMGGSTQILFGILGRRWDEDANFRKFPNEAWVRPSEEEKPKRFRLQENGSYW